MVVYVDDFILISPAKHEARIWKELDKHILFKDPPAPLQRFPGRNHDISIRSDGTYLQSAVKEYMRELNASSLPWVPAILAQAVVLSVAPCRVVAPA